ncbi:MAG: hypothetical protein COA73_00360 [Candidatus Hydrogenedentota bacterium]|nr:MAG: hypothetical protein COA73_00360 [Candidatus Hydrogenedentota bacterium]
MKRSLSMLTAMFCAFGMLDAMAGTVKTPTIQGTYIEARTCDVYTAACFANSEVGLAGEEAIMAWDVREGAFNGVDLSGLKVVAVVRANATLGDTAADPLPAKAIIIYDARASKIQRKALSAFVKDMAGELVANVVREEITDITMNVDKCTKDGCGSLRAGDLVAIETRCIHQADNTCGNDTNFYGPLTDVIDAMPHFTSYEKFSGEGLGIKWNDGGRRGAFLATFAR